MTTLFVLILALPMLTGQWLAAPLGDQLTSGYAFDAWSAEVWRATGSIPLWNPLIMGGLPYIAPVTHGDVLYPTSLLRFLLPAHVVTNWSFVLHYVLAGFLTYLFLRKLEVTWTGAVTGGLAYQLTGLMLSYAYPGHDGKLFVSALLPLAFIAVHAALRERRFWGYPLLATTVALWLLSPHVQLTYYALIAAGLFALYCVVGEPSSEPARTRVGRLALAAAAVLVGFAIAAPQILPFLEYIPHSPRAAGYSVGYAASASYGIPWNHVPELFIAGFTGEYQAGTYWGSNPIKLHSEYLGVPVIALAILGFGDRRRRLVWWLGGIGLLFLLIALGGATPFYRLWWTVMPYVRKTRAPGMVFFVVAFCTAVFAAFGLNRLERGEVAQPMRHVRAWLVAAGVIALLALAGVFGRLAEAMAPEGRMAAATALGPAIRWSAVIGAIALAAVALVVLGWLRGRLPVIALALGVTLLVGVDLWRDGRRFWVYSGPPDETLYRSDAIVERLQRDTLPFRVLDLEVYPQNALMAHGIPQVLGYQGQELRYYDELLGGRNQWSHLLNSTRLWELLSVRYVLLPDTIAIPGYRRILGPVETGPGTRGYLYEAEAPPPYARVVPAAAKIEDEAIPPTLADPRLPGFDRVVLLGQDAPILPPPVTSWPPPSPARARVTAWRAGAMTVELDPTPPADSYLLISENWYLDWRASVDGRPAMVLRGDHALLTVPVPAGARHVDLTYHSKSFARGKLIGLLGVLVVVAGFLGPSVARWRRRG